VSTEPELSSKGQWVLPVGGQRHLLVQFSHQLVPDVESLTLVLLELQIQLHYPLLNTLEPRLSMATSCLYVVENQRNALICEQPLVSLSM